MKLVRKSILNHANGQYTIYICILPLLINRINVKTINKWKRILDISKVKERWQIIT